LVPSAPAQPTNPTFFVADSSALLQLILPEEMRTLRALKTDYGIQCVITEAVEGELRRKLQNKFPEKSGVLRKAVHNGTIIVLSEAALSAGGYKSAAALIDQIEQLGRTYALRIDRGEAYTHAASNILGVPSLSQDLEALWRLINAGVYVQRPILRAFDVVIFGLQIGILSEDDCKQVRKDLLRCDQGILSCFRNCAVIDGLPSFYQRLCDAEKTPLGASAPVEKLDERIWIRRTAQG
jgi:hypothetical protein